MPMTRVRDIDVYYESRGEGDPLLLIHGLGSSTEDWEAQVEFFAKRFRVVSYDVRGHGKSGKPRSRYSVPQFAADAAALIEHLQLGPAHVLGISMGGMVALQLTVDRPDLVRSLTVVNSGPEMVLRTWRQKIAIYQRFAIVRMMGMRRMGQVLSKALLPLPEHASHRQLFVERWARNHPGAYLRSLRALIGWTVTQRLGAIACPTLILTADMDYTPVAFKQWYTAQIPGAELAVIAGARHMLPVERPDEFNEAVANFLWKLPARATATPTLGLGTSTRSATA